MVTMQLPVPVQALLQPANVDPEAGVAVRVTAVPLAKLAEQVEPQLMAPPATVPLPVPCLVTVSAKVVPPEELKVATTVRAWFRVTAQVPVPVQALLQPADV